MSATNLLLPMLSDGNSSGSGDPYIGNVELLIHGDGTNGADNNVFIDSSANNLAISKYMYVNQGPRGPFPGACSAYFPGPKGSLALPNTGFNFGTGDFTVEAWAYQPTAGDMCIFSIAQTFGLMVYSGNVLRAMDKNGNNILIASSTFPTNQWVHVAFTRSSGTVRLFMNGALVASGTNTTNYSSPGSVRVGLWLDATNFYWVGSIAELRVVKGYALYTSAFTPPTAILQDVPGTSALLHFANAGITDQVKKHIVSTEGTTQVSTSVKKFGTGSIYLPGTSCIGVPMAEAPINLGASDFTIEMWVYPTAISSGGTIASNWPSGSGMGSWEIKLDTSGTLYCTVRAANTTNSMHTTLALVANSWNHIALVRVGVYVYTFINGVKDSVRLTVSGSVTDSTGYTSFGNSWDYSSYFKGYLDEIRITKGVARYTANFTPPTAAFPDT